MTKMGSFSGREAMIRLSKTAFSSAATGESRADVAVISAAWGIWDGRTANRFSFSSRNQVSARTPMRKWPGLIRFIRVPPLRSINFFILYSRAM